MVAILHNVRSLHNVGSIFRTADAVGIEKLYLCGITPAPVDRFGKVRPQIHKVALGAERFVKWDGSARSPRAVLKLLARLRSEGYNIIAVEQDEKAIPYYKLRLADSRINRPRRFSRGSDPKASELTKLALVFGNEVRGLPATILRKADTIVEIPMRGAMIRQAHHPRNQARKVVRQVHHKESLNVAVAFGIVAFHCAVNR